MRYRFLMPWMLAVVSLQQVLRIGVGLLDPSLAIERRDVEGYLEAFEDVLTMEKDA